MSEIRKIKCIKFGVELPGMKRKPFPDEFGQRLYDQVSQDAWNLWLKEMTKMINEYRLSMKNTEHQAYLRKVMAHFFFQEGEPPPPPGDGSPIKFV
jgi:Fe-S cluster biosynthesis and repair protein YggX